MMPGFYMLMSTKKWNTKLNSQNYMLNTTNLIGGLYKIEKDKIICPVEF